MNSGQTPTTQINTIDASAHSGIYLVRDIIELPCRWKGPHQRIMEYGSNVGAISARKPNQEGIGARVDENALLARRVEECQPSRLKSQFIPL